MMYSFFIVGVDVWSTQPVSFFVSGNDFGSISVKYFREHSVPIQAKYNKDLFYSNIKFRS